MNRSNRSAIYPHKKKQKKKCARIGWHTLKEHHQVNLANHGSPFGRFWIVSTKWHLFIGSRKKNEKTKNKLIKKAKEHYQLNVTGVVPQLDHNNPCLMDHGLDLLSLMFHKATKFLM